MWRPGVRYDPFPPRFTHEMASLSRKSCSSRAGRQSIFFADIGRGSYATAPPDA